VEGIHFQQLHAFFEEQYDAIAGYIDEIAERIRAIGHYAPGSMGEFATLARLDEASHFDGNAQKMLSAILEDNESIIQSLRLDQDKVLEVYNDVGTQDFLVGLMQEHEKMAWMLRAHLA
jgi:starvation-inducible DNA-binding protein